MEIDKLQFKPVSYSDDISNLALMAKEIWEEHYTPIIGKDQVNYMIDKFQSESAIIQQIKDDYDYFIVSRYSQHIGYLCFIKNNEINSLFLSKIYLKKPFRRMGYGREMFEFVKRQASKKRYQSITNPFPISITSSLFLTNPYFWYARMVFLLYLFTVRVMD